MCDESRMVERITEDIYIKVVLCSLLSFVRRRRRRGKGGGARSPLKFRKKYFSGNYYVKFRHFSGKNHVKFGNFVNFSGKYHKN